MRNLGKFDGYFPIFWQYLTDIFDSVEMLALSIAWWFIFSPSDSVFRHILDSANAAEPEGVGAEGIVLEERAPGSKQAVLQRNRTMGWMGSPERLWRECVTRENFGRLGNRPWLLMCVTG